MSAATAKAGNGLNVIGSGLESSAMAGADTAVARDPLALNTNPAGLTQLDGWNVELHGVLAWVLGGEHGDQFNHSQSPANETVSYGDLGIARRLDRYPVTVGAGLLVVGGAGPVYKETNTPFGGEDELSSVFAIGRIAVGGAVEITDQLSLGANVGVTYSDLNQKFFPDTSVFNPTDPAGTFFGTELTQSQAYGFGGRIGLRYELTDRLALSAIYASRVDLPADSDRLVVNFGALGLGRVQYRDVHVDGFGLPQEVGVGAAWRPVDKLLLAVDVTWLDWSSAMNELTIRAKDPDDERAPSKVENKVSLNWRDQYVLAVGAAYQATDALRLWAGYNYGRNPIPAHNLSPFLDNIGEHHFTAGAGYSFGDGWRVGIAGEYWLPNEVDCDNPGLPFGSDTHERLEWFALHVGVSKHW